MLLVVLAAMGVAVLVVARLDAMRLSATAAAAITTRSVTGGSSFDQSPSGTWLTYSYAVDGTTFSGKTFRRWINVDARQPKICYDPSEPGRHLLVEGSYVCGSGG